MDIIASTQQFEAWLAGLTPLFQPDLDYKHQQMANKEDAFPFFRGTYYRWSQHWQETSAAWKDAPAVLAIGDLHIENFGTWRDAEGRLCWGINDFDEVDRLPYTQDLIRLAASVRLAKHAGEFDIKLSAACQAILSGYRETLEKEQGMPFVLEEKYPELRSMATARGREPAIFWKKFESLRIDAPAIPPAPALAILLADLPTAGLNPEYRHRPQVGMGSLGKPRFLALTSWHQNWIARETKPTTPPASTWAQGRKTYDSPALAVEALQREVRSPDPYYRIQSDWTARRLAPLCSRIDLSHLKQSTQIELVLQAMGSETANVHLGSANPRAEIRADLGRRKAGWLEEAAHILSDAIENDWRVYRKA